MPKFLVTHLVGVEIVADNAFKAEARIQSLFPSNEEIEEKGKVVRTYWSIELQEELLATVKDSKLQEELST